MAQLGVNDLRIDLLLKPAGLPYRQWSNETGNVRIADGVKLARGRTGEADSASPSSAQFTFDNSTGRYSPRYAGGALFGNLMPRNQPVRVGLGIPVQGGVATGTGTTATSPAVAYTGFSTGTAAHTVYMTPAGNVTIPSGYSNIAETDYATFTQSRSRLAVSASPLAAAASTLSASGTWAAAGFVVPGATFSVSSDAGGTAGGNTNGIDYSAGNGNRVVVAVAWWSADPGGRMQPPTFDTQLRQPEVYLVADSGPSTGPRIAVWAWRQDGVQDGGVFLLGAQDGSTSCGLSVTWWDNASDYSPRFAGEISEWPVRFDQTDRDRTVPVDAGGITRRLIASSAGASALLAALRSDPGLLAYWPMEETPGVNRYQPTIGREPFYAVPTPPATVVAGANGDVAGSKNLPTWDNTLGSAKVPPTGVVEWGFGAVVAFSTTPLVGSQALLYAGGAGTPSGLGSLAWGFFQDTTLPNRVGTTLGGGNYDIDVSAAFPDGIAGQQAFLYMGMKQNGANVDTTTLVYNITPGSRLAGVSRTQTETAFTLAACQTMNIGYGIPGFGTFPITNGAAVGHVFLNNRRELNSPDFKAWAGRGYADLVSRDAFQFYCRDNGVQTLVCHMAAVDLVKAGPVGNGALYESLKLLETGAQSLLQDAAGFVGVEWHQLAGLESQTPVVTLSYTADTFTGEFAPVDDDAVVRNDVIATSTKGPSGRYVDTTSALGAQPGGVGRYAKSYTAATQNGDTAQYLAEWLVHIGVHDAARWPTVTLQMRNPGAVGVYLPELSVGDWVRLSNLPALAGVTPVDLQITGFKEEFDSGLYRLSLVCRLADPLNVVIPDASAAQWDTIGDDTNPTLYAPVYLGM